MRCKSAWECGAEYVDRMKRTEKLYRMHLELFERPDRAMRARLFIAHQLYAAENWAEAAREHETVVQTIGKAGKPEDLKMQLESAYHAITARAHLAGLAERPLELPEHAAIRERLMAFAANKPLPAVPAARKDPKLDELLATVAMVEGRLAQPPQPEYLAQLMGRAHHARHELEQAETRLQGLLDRAPQALDTWGVTPLLLDCMVRSKEPQRARALAGQLLEDSRLQWRAAGLVHWDQEPGKKLSKSWRPVLEALAAGAPR